MFEAFILIPIRDNDGVPFTRHDYTEFEARIAGFASGATLRAHVSGLWIESGQQFREPMLEYEIDLDSLRQVADVLALAEWARRRFRQLAILVRVAGVVEVIRGP